MTTDTDVASPTAPRTPELPPPTPPPEEAADRSRPDPEGEASVVHRVRLVALCLVLTAATFLQEPGRLAADTKIDLTADPWRFLGRALHLWEPLGFLGQIQNQAYGYLFPMGPFFALGHAVGMPEWVVQRLWVSLILCLALVGVERLASALGIGTPSARIFAALAYALAPRMMTTLGPTSIEALPMALAPWVVLPLVRGSRIGSPRKAALMSAVALLCMGGVNAVETAAVLPLAALYLLTRARGPRRRRLIGWWSVGVVAACLWWLIPLLVLGKYSPPFLSWIESARTTTSKTSLVEVLRGTSDWVAFLGGPFGPDLRGGWQLVTNPAAVLDTAILAVVGLVGLCLPGIPERRWLRLSLLAGVALVGFGHVGAADGLAEHWQRALLDGSLAPLRNVHKFEPVLRLPLALALAHVVGAVLKRGGFGQRQRSVQVGVLGLVVVGLVGAAMPLLTGTLLPSGTYASIPGYWTQTASWLSAHDADGRALLVPGASFGDYVWGSPKDEPLQALATTPWAVRDAVPLTNAGGIRMLDAIQSRIATGTVSAGLASYLARNGFAYVVVRNDLDSAVASAPRPVLVHQTLDLSGGLRRVASFGPTVGGGSTAGLQLDQRLDRAYPAVEIYQVEPASATAVYVPASGVGAVQAAPEGLLDSLDAGADVPAAALLNGGPETTTRLVTDTPARREVHFGAVDQNTSAVLAPEDPLRLDNPVLDYLPAGSAAYTTVARQLGIAVAASSSRSDPATIGGSQPQHQPFAAVDGDPATAWISQGVGGAVGQWLSLTFPRTTSLRGGVIDVATDLIGPQVDTIDVSVDGDPVVLQVPDDGLVPLPAVNARTVRISAVAVAGGGSGTSFGINEVTVPGVTATRPLVVPVGGAATGFVLSAPVGAVSGCVRDGGQPVCATGLQSQGEEDGGIDRILAGSEPASYAISVQAVARAGQPLDALLSAGWPARVTATSQSVTAPDGSPARVLDGDVRTGWVAAPSDHDPTLTFTFDTPQTITGLQVVVGPELAASRPGAVTLTMDGRTVHAELGPTGIVRFPATTTTTAVVSFADVDAVQSLDPFAQEVTVLPVGASEITFVGAESLRAVRSDSDVVTWKCGEGPTVTVDGATYATTGSATVGQLRTAVPLSLRGCDPAVQVPKDARVTALPTSTLTVRSVSLGSGGTPPSTTAVALERPTWGATDRTLSLPARATAGVVAVRETANIGWRATLGGVVLTPVTIDGWQQGWSVPAGAAGTIHLTFAPDQGYRIGLLVGLLAALLLLVGAFGVRTRRHRAELAPSPAAELARVRSVDPWVVGAAAITLAIVCAPAVPVLVVLAVLARWGPWRGRAAAWWGVVPVLAAGAAFVALALYPLGSLGPYAGDWGWVQIAVAVSLAAVAVVPPSVEPSAGDAAPEAPPTLGAG